MASRNQAHRAHVQTTIGLTTVLRTGLQKLPAIEPVNKSQRALSVLLRNLEELEGSL